MATKRNLSSLPCRKANQEQGFEEGWGQRPRGLWKFGG